MCNKNKAFAAGIVSYNPDIKRFKENIDSILSQVDKLIIIENGSRESDKIIKIIKSYDENCVKLVVNSKNMGIARALNQIRVCAEKENYKWDYYIRSGFCMP